MKRIFLILSLFVMNSYADTETINWYVDGQIRDTTTCESGGNIIVPTPTPTKRGYSFSGWIVALYDFSTLDTSENGTSGSEPTRTSWRVNFPYGVISGISLCSSTQMLNNYVVGTPDESGTGDTQYCWCKVTNYTPAGSNITYKPIQNLPWFYCTYLNTPAYCDAACAYHCGREALIKSLKARQVGFGIMQ